MGVVSQCLISTSRLSPWTRPQTETTINSSTQNTFLRIHRPIEDVQPPRPKWPHVSGLLWLSVLRFLQRLHQRHQSRMRRYSKTVGNRGLHNVRGLMSWYAFISSSYSSWAQRKSPPSDTLSLVYTEHQSVMHSKSYFMMMWWHLVFSHGCGNGSAGLSVAQKVQLFKFSLALLKFCTFIFAKGCILQILVIPWLFLWCHHEVAISDFDNCQMDRCEIWSRYSWSP